MSLSCRGLTLRYGDLDILRGVDLDVADGETIAIHGASGTGKSTLLHCLGLLDRPDGGSITITGTVVDHLDQRQRARLAATSIGFVFQAFHLLNDFDVLENILMAARTAGLAWGTAVTRANALLERVGLADKGRRRVDTLSGGERSRVALCRALLNQPAVILADEPTGNLDPAIAALVLQQLLDLARDAKSSVVIVTHDPGIAERCDRVLELRGGKLRKAGAPETATVPKLP